MNKLTGEQKKEILKEVEKEIYRRSFFKFVQKACTVLEPSTKWKFIEYHEYLCNVLQKETERIAEGRPRDKHLIINVPFRSGKSLIVSILYPIWSWIINPSMQFINLSYSDNLSTDHSNKVVALIHSKWFQDLYGWEFDDVQRSKTDFKLKHGGQRLSGGVAGTILGRGGDVIIIDDGNNTKRLSAVERHNTIKSWKDTISTRLNDPEVGLFINIQQRLHQEDLTGYLLENEPDNWEQICLPAELSDNVNPPELTMIYEDGLLWKDRFSRKVLDNFKLVLGTKNYANQLNQQTHAEEGNIIKKDWIETITLEQLEAIVKSKGKRFNPTWDLFLDTAYTSKQTNDASAILVACKIDNMVYVRKAFEVRLEFPELITKIKEVHNLYCKENSRIFIEIKASGYDVYNTLKRDTNISVIKLESPKDDKETRLNAVSPLIESGRLILIEDISNGVVIEQLTGFPQTKHDDVMDTVVYALMKYISKSNNFNYMLL